MHADGKSTLSSVSKWNSGKVNSLRVMTPEVTLLTAVLPKETLECRTSCQFDLGVSPCDLSLAGVDNWSRLFKVCSFWCIPSSLLQ